MSLERLTKMAAVYENLEGGEIDYDDMLQAKLANLEKEVKALHLQKRKFEQLHREPVEFWSLASKTRMERKTNSQKHFQQVENKLLLKKLIFQRLSGVVVVKREGKNIILEFSASVRGHYCQPGYAHFRKVGGGSWAVIRYFLPDSVNVREMVEASPLNSDRELINFIHYVQLCVEAYHDRKYQITCAKEWAEANGVKLFSSIDCMFVTLTVQETNLRPFPLTICLIYEATAVRPASLEAQSKGIDRKTLAKTEEECDALKKLSLDEGLAILFLKHSESSRSSQSEEDDAFHVLEEMNSKQQRRVSVQ